MSNLTLWINDTLYPALFDFIPSAFPEHDFQEFSGGWRSKTYLSGEPHSSRADKTVITKKVPSRIMEQGGPDKSLVDYVMDRYGVEVREAVKHLAEIAGLTVPNSPGYDPEAYRKQAEQASLLEACQSYFTSCLEKDKGAETTRAYLEERGYSKELYLAMDLGYIPSQDKLYKYLKGKDYTEKQIDSLTFDQDKRIGESHSLTIPYRSGGSIKGFKFRTIGQDKNKYLNSKGLDKGSLFNLSPLKGDKDLRIVEGELDCLHATALGFENVVALAGSSLSPGAVQDALKRGAKSFTLCFDRETDPQKAEATAQKVNRAIEVILAEGVNRVYTVTLPALGDKTDPDSLLKKQGKEALQKAIDQPRTYYTHKLTEVIKPYRSIQKKRPLTDKEIDKLLDEIVITGSKISDPTDRDRFKKLFTDHEFTKGLGITEASLSETIERLTTTRRKETQTRELNKAIVEAKSLLDKGQPGQAIALLETQAKEIKTLTATGLLPPPLSYDSLLEDIANLPEAKRTGYPSLDKFTGFTPGAITLIAGRPSHGKTSFMLNLLLNMADLYKEETFYFFTYEEPIKNLSVKLLNTLIGETFSQHFKTVKDLARPTNYEFIKAYIRAGGAGIEAIEAIEEGHKKLRGLIEQGRIKLIDRNYSVEELNSLLSLQSKQENIGAVFIDYIQRMRTTRRTQDKRTEIAHISDQILQTAKETGLPIILGAQINRSSKDNEGKKPRLENLKEAGNLEEDANTVLSVYNAERESGDSTAEREIELEIKALKNREGEANKKTTLTFDKWTGAIKEQNINSGNL
jgi:DNA primase catalytic core